MPTKTAIYKPKTSENQHWRSDPGYIIIAKLERTDR